MCLGKRKRRQLTEATEEAPLAAEDAPPAMALEALEAAAPTLEVMEASPPAEEEPPPMVTPEVAEVKDAPAPVAEAEALYR